MKRLLLFAVFSFVCVRTELVENKLNFKDQFCTDPRTMEKHAAYSEWADAYSCTRHRCQPGGRNLAIYTVGCKHVEAPESAIECEEVVEDNNMQFPYCCTRLRCLVVVRGEVWTRVLGQPWETLDAAPWSHMYKMKKPPPGDKSFLPEKAGPGPVYEIQANSDSDHDIAIRSKKMPSEQNCDKGQPRAAPAPDIVIALSTSNDVKELKSKGETMLPRQKHRKSGPRVVEDMAMEPIKDELEEEHTTEKIQHHKLEPVYEEKYVDEPLQPSASWTEIPQIQWDDQDPNMDTDGAFKPHQNYQTNVEKGKDKGNLQALVDAIGTRMRDIENVVQRMGAKVHQAKSSQEPAASGEQRPPQTDAEFHSTQKQNDDKERKPLEAYPDSDNYKRFSARRGSKYLHGVLDTTTENPLFIEDKLNGYYSDASNILHRGSPKNPPMEPLYMAPIDTRPKPKPSEEEDKDKEAKKKKRTHKRKRNKIHHKKHHNKDDKKKRFNKVTSTEMDKNLLSLEDSSALVMQ